MRDEGRPLGSLTGGGFKPVYAVSVKSFDRERNILKSVKRQANNYAEGELN
jgi:hypothetical protein